MCELGVFPIFLENDLLKVNKILGLTFLKARKDFEGFKMAFFHFLQLNFCSMDCLQLPFIRVEEAFSWTQNLLTTKIWPKNRSLWQTKMKANFCRNSTFQVNRTKNATGTRRLTSSDWAAIFVSTSCEERHNKLFWLYFSSFSLYFTLYKAFPQVYVSRRTK